MNKYQKLAQAEVQEEQETMQWAVKFFVPAGIIIFVASFIWTLAMVGA